MKKYFMAKAVVLAITVILAGGFLFPQTLSLTKTGEAWKYDFYNVCVSGNYAYCANGEAGMEILNIADPAAPVRVGKYYSGGKAYDVSVKTTAGQTYAYLADGHGGLQVIDVTNPASPRRVGNYDMSSLYWPPAYAVHIAENCAYVAYGSNGLVILDISTPSDPKPVSVYQTKWDAVDVFTEGNKCYVVSRTIGGVTRQSNSEKGKSNPQESPGGALEILDISNRINPKKLGGWDIYGLLEGVWVNGNFAYVTGIEYDGSGRSFWVMDVSNPALPAPVSSIKGMHGFYDLFYKDGYVYAAGEAYGFYIIDVSTPSLALVSGRLETGGEGKGLYVSGNTAFFADKMAGLHTIDISRKNLPARIGTYRTPGSYSAYKIKVQGNYAYITNAYSPCALQIYDISKPDPVLSSERKYSNFPTEVEVSGNYAYVALGSEGFEILDITNPAAPVKTGSLNPGGYISSMSITGDYLYTSGNYVVQVFDVSDRTAPVLVTTIPDRNTYVHINGNYAYSYTSIYGMQIFDLTNPASPTFVGSANVGNISSNIEFKGNFAYFGKWGEIQIWDMSDPAKPSHVKTVQFPDTEYSSHAPINTLSISGNYLFAATMSGVFGFDISAPANPVIAGYYSTSSEVISLHADNGKIYCTSQGIFVLSYASSGSRPSIRLSETQLNFTAYTNGAASSSLPFRISNAGGGSLSWELSPNDKWMTCSSLTGNGGGEVYVSVAASGKAPGKYQGTITVTDPLADNSPQYITVNLEVKLAGGTAPPFGDFSLPADGSTVSGSIAVTGWALDDIGVQKVQLFWQNGDSLAYIDDALFVEGARPDVQGAFPGYPNNNRAGWGYMLLTNYLPKGDGTYTLHAIATDIEGNTTSLGTKTITVDNANSTQPFGAIDTPHQGGIVSGTGYVNFGWALTPQPNTIPFDGSTITVLIDGKPVGNPVYNQYRKDIANYFPGYNNSDGAVGYFYLDLLQMEDGLHTIQWTVKDDAGNIDGIGSRFFSVANGARSQAKEKKTARADFYGYPRSKRTSEPGVIKKLGNINADRNLTVIGVRTGYNLEAPFSDVYADEPGMFKVDIRPNERVEIRFPFPPAQDADGTKQDGYSINGFHRMGDKNCRLPAGSFVDSRENVFYWQPGPGFAGKFRLVFVIEGPYGQTDQVIVDVMVGSVSG